ncbi:MAG: FIST C-terminal domain-containing protein [Synergistaceae bacterium]|jgi:hypothetical protein|nr:FIST C-terminal domain-containing protein [Synergistaceae bacterium]
MLKMLSAATDEIDDVEAAIAELLGQLDLEHDLLKNSIGIVSCHSEFIDSGVVRALCSALPFSTVGCTTLASTTRGSYGFEILSVAVLTSDDVAFSAVLSQPITSGNVEGRLTDAYGRACSALGGKPTFALAYLPLMTEIGASPVYRCLARLCGNTPLFGTFSCENTMRFLKNRVLWNGECFKDASALVLMSGNVNPRFFTAAIPKKMVQKQRAVITESDGCVIKKINDLTAVDYLVAKNLIDYSDFEAQGIVAPFLTDYHDGTGLVARTLYSFTSDGGAVCGSEIPAGATIAIASLDYSGVIETAKEVTLDLLRVEEKSGILMYSSIARNLVLGINPDDEMTSVLDLLGDDTPYAFCYSGGAICPVKTGDGGYLNHYHDFTFTACAFLRDN